MTVIDNYNNSGRTMLKVIVKEQFSRAILTYNTISTWDSIIEYGTAMHNSVAYETGNESITGGQKDNGGDILDSKYMSGLDSECDGYRFIYTEHNSVLRFLVASFTGLYKKVKSENDTIFTEETNVRQNSRYSYKLRYSTSTISRAKNIVFYDSLENFSFEGKQSEWHGSLSYVDISQAEEMGIKPVVYYSAENLKIEEHNDLEEVIDGEKVWKTAEEFGDIKAAKTIAVDLRHDKNGNDFVLDYRSAVSVNVYMRSPLTDESGSDDPVCYNNVYMKNTVIDILDNEQSNFIHQDNTTVHLRVAGDLNIEKRGSEQGNPAIDGIEFTLEGVSSYNTEIKLTQKSDKYGHIEFENIEKGQNYILYESAGSDDYLPIDHVYAVVVDDSGNVTVDGQPVENGNYFLITDDPRIHTDIEFFKRDIVHKQNLISGVTFLLSGTSVYGSPINVQSTSVDGKVTFRNIEKGNDYTLTEYFTTEGYIKSKVKYKVRVDDNAHFFISSEDEIFTSDTELNGTVSVYNEPYHKFTLQKEGTIKIDGEAMPVRGAEYRFWGTSAYGTEYDITKTTQANGRIYFDNLESGTYHLKETQAPEGYELDTTEYIVEITPEDEITIKGEGRIVSRNNMGYYVFTDTEKGTITITKKWIDTEESKAQRLADGTEPIIHISTEPKKSEAYFRDNNVLSTVAGSKNNVLYFKPYLGNDDYALELISNGTAKRIDDRTTDFKIYGWYISDETAEDYKTVYWWSDAKYVYLKPGGYYIWAESRNLISIDVSGINSSKLTSMSSMFNDCRSMQSLVGLDSFDTSNVTSFASMFNWCRALKVFEGYENWDTSQATSMNSMFKLCQALPYLDLSNWVTSNVTDMSCMFGYRVDGWGTDLSWHSLKSIDFGDNFDTSKVTDMSFMFAGCSSLTELDLSNFDTSNVTTMAYMFSGNPYAYPNYGKPMNLEKITLSDKFDTSNVKSMYRMFYGCRKLETLDLSSFDTGNCTTMYQMFYDCNVLTVADVSNFDTTKVTTMYGMFSGCNLLSTINVSGFDTQNVTDMAYMFDRCNAVTVLDVSDFKTQNVTNMAYMFNGCGKITEIDVTNFVTSNVTNMAYMFSGCSGLTELDVTHFVTTEVTTLEGTFQSCSKLTSLDLSNFKTSKVINLYGTFKSCTNLIELDLRSFDTSMVTTMESLFYNCIKIVTVDLSSFDNTKVTRAFYFFFNCQKLKTVYVSERWTEFSNSIAHTFFTSCTNIVGGQGTGFDYNYTNGVYARIDNPPDAPGYFTYKPAPTTTGSGVKTVTNMRTTSTSAGTSYVSTDDNCSIKVLSDDIWEYTFTNIPPDMKFYTWEEELSGYTSENMGEVYNKEVVDGRATIVNVAEGYDIPDEHFGNLTIKKLVVKSDGSELTEEQAAKKFSFNLRLFDVNNDPVTDTMLFGSVAYGRNGATFTLAHDEMLTITGIPAGYSYRVTETNESGYTSQVSEGDSYGVIPSDDTVSVTFTNTLVDESLMSFRLKKVVNGNYENTNERYPFLISIIGLQSGKTYSITGDVELTFTAESQEITQIELELMQNESVSVELPVGAKYMVTEFGGDYTSAYNITDPSNIEGGILQSSGSTMNKKNTSLNTAFETADEGESVTVTFTNTKDVRQDLTLIKKVVNAASSEQFEFTADFLGLYPFETIDLNIYDQSGTQLTAFRETADGNGRIEGLMLYLTGNEKIVFGQLPVGTRYRISEGASSYKASYRIVASGDQSIIASNENDLIDNSLTTGVADENGVYTDEGMNIIHEGSDIEVTFTNTKVQHDITITKIADFSYSELTYSDRKALEFSFNIHLEGLSTGKSYKMYFTEKNTTGILREDDFTSDDDGNKDLTIILKDGMSCKISDLPNQAKYIVTEAAYRNFISEYVIEGNNGSQVAKSSDINLLTQTELHTAEETVDTNDFDIRIVYTNRYTASDYELPSTGFKYIRLFRAIAFGGIIIFAVAFVLSRKKIRV